MQRTGKPRYAVELRGRHGRSQGSHYVQAQQAMQDGVNAKQTTLVALEVMVSDSQFQTITRTDMFAM